MFVYHKRCSKAGRIVDMSPSDAAMLKMDGLLGTSSSSWSPNVSFLWSACPTAELRNTPLVISQRINDGKMNWWIQIFNGPQKRIEISFELWIIVFYWIKLHENVSYYYDMWWFVISTIHVFDVVHVLSYLNASKFRNDNWEATNWIRLTNCAWFETMEMVNCFIINGVRYLYSKIQYL